MRKVALGILVLASLGISVQAHIGPTSGSRGGKKPSGGLAANCSPSSFASELDINNTRALIQTGGDMWWDFAIAQYEIPKNSGHTALFAGALWLGGRDVSGQLKVAAQRFRSQGVDFWTGPLSTVDAEISQSECAKWDKHFPTTRNEVAQFVGWYETGQNDPAKQAELFPDYTIPRSILEWPAHGDDAAPLNQDYYLAPFVDRDGDGNYNPENGDYPAYDLNNSSECKANITDIYGDQNLWWVFNDKGNIHSETGAGAIGMEIRAQAFAFSTNDEVNNMTFYNYELVNRSTFTLTDTYFGQWVDADLGCSQDDYVGCDVERGLGYCYNGDAFDEDCRGATGYGNLPPAIGVDFFQGPYQDPDGVDNPLIRKYTDARNNDGIPYKGIGIGYGDGVIDNERFGMRKFLYHNNARDVRGDPTNGVEYYNYLRSIWRDGSRMIYGGTGHQGGSGGGQTADYMFPGDTDPIGWGTEGTIQPEWTEVTAGNTKGDRRFMQSAGPFTLEPGAVNNITVGVVWSRATTGNNESSVAVLRKHDDKTQALFDNCFQLLNGPDAPNLTIQEFENELVLYLDNPVISNNYNEGYEEQDPTIIPPDSLGGRPLTDEQIAEYKTYRFQGYLIYQVKDNSVSSGDLGEPDRARLIAQVDIRDTITRVINKYFDNDLGAEVPVLEVDGENEGIRTSFRIEQDEFAEGDKKLINNKSYYFMAVAYATNMNSENLPYIGSRKSTTGGILPVRGIPHKTSVENGGTILNSKYGDGVVITRIEGTGNGGNELEIAPISRDSIVTYGRAKTITYMRGKGPINIKVVDPLNVKPGNYTIRFVDTTSNGDLSDAYWQIEGGSLKEPLVSTKNISVGTETIIFDLGISITIGQIENPGAKLNRNTDMGFISASVEQSAEWLTGVEDVDGYSPLNWILSGTQTAPPDPNSSQAEEHFDDWNYRQRSRGAGNGFSKNGEGLDDGQVWEQVLSGTVAPARMVAARSSNGPIPAWLPSRVDGLGQPGLGHLWQYNSTILREQGGDDSVYVISADSMNQLHYLNSVDIVITSDKSKWTRCPVIEMADTFQVGTATPTVLRGQLRDAPSVDKDGNPASEGALASDNPESPAYIGPRGMGWFPGYAINLETGERLNMAFSENSLLPAENGRDMIWNPTSTLTEGPAGEMRLGGMHYIYVFRNNAVEDEYNRYDFYRETQIVSPLLNFLYNEPEYRMPAYDAGKFAYEKLKDIKGLVSNNPGDDSTKAQKNRASSVYRAAMWVAFPLLEEDFEFNGNVPPGEATVKLRVQKPYESFGTTNKYLSWGDPIEVGKEYYVAAGPVKHKLVSDSLQDSIYVRGMTFTPKSTSYELTYANYVGGTTARPGNDSTNILMETVNGGLPLYNFSTTDLAPTFNSTTTLQDALEDIKVVPNPYYAYSTYETDKLDNRIRITNLPKTVNVRIYTVNGILIRTLKKDDESITYLEWDLKNEQRVPIASGMYIFHVEAPGVGEKVLKWLGIMRPIDLDNF